MSSFFLWKDGSELAGMFWNELDFEKLGADCHLETNAFYGKPAAVHVERHTPPGLDICGGFHTYTYEWTPEYIAWFVDDMEIRRMTGAAATAYAENATAGMQIRFNVWPGDATFGGNFSPDILPVHQYVDWVQFSSYANGAFTVDWRDDFNGTTLSADWLTGSWGSPKNLSTHDSRNVNVLNGYAVLSLTADDAVGPAGAMPGDGAGGTDGAAGTGGTGTGGTGGASGTSGSPSSSAGAAGSPPSMSDSDDGDGCAVSPSPTSRPSLLFFALGLAALTGISRRMRRASREGTAR